MQILASRTKGAGQSPGNRLRHFLKFAGGIDQKGRHGAGGVLSGRGQQFLEVLGSEDGIVVDDQEMGEVGKFFESVLASGGETAPKAEIFAGGEKLAGNRRLLGRLHGGAVGTVIADHGRKGANRLAGQRVE